MIISTDLEEILYLTDSGTPVCQAHIQPYIDTVIPASLTDYDAWLQCHGSTMSCQRCSGGAYDSQRDRMDARISGEGSAERRAGNLTTGDDCGETTTISPSFIRYAQHRHFTYLA